MHWCDRWLGISAGLLAGALMGPRFAAAQWTASQAPRTPTTTATRPVAPPPATTLATAPATVPAVTQTAPAPPRPLGTSTLSGEQVTEDDVTKSIQRGVEKLLKLRNKEGNWENPASTPHDRFHGGPTCLALYALLHVGQSLDDERLKPRSEELAPAIKFINELQPTGTYVASLQASVFSLLPRRPETLARLTRLRDMFATGITSEGGYNYYTHAKRGDGGADNSNSQYGVLGMWAVYDAGVSVPGKYWHDVEKFWRGRYQAPGGWGYMRAEVPTVSMTAAGVASLYVVTEHTDATLRNESKPDAQLETALTFLARGYQPKQLDGYTLYGVERVGLASGRKYLGDQNWFVEGAAALLARQQADGGWSLGDREMPDRVSTSFALLFLARGRNPVVFNKLEYSGSTWDARPRDAANVTAWMARQFERPINWQIVGFNMSPDEWRDAPVLLITGSKDPNFTPEQVEKLRRFAREGGLIFSTADAGSAEFTAAMQRYAEEVVERKYPWRELPADHSVYKVYQLMKEPAGLMGVSTGVREWWIHAPQDLGAAWHQRVRATEADRKAGKTDKDRPWDIAANVLFYANGRGELRSKLQSTAVMESNQRPVRSMTVGRLKYGGNWDPEPGAYDRLSRIAFSRWHTSLEFKPVTFDTLNTVRVITMTGHEKFELTDDERGKLVKFLDGGGVLVADALNSSKDFDKSFQALVQQMYAAERWDVLDNRSSLFIGNLVDTAPLRETQLRALTQQEAGNLKSPRIYRLLTREGKLRIVYSPFDMTLGYLGTSTTGFSGYTPESAEMLARNIYIYLHALTSAGK